jgi:hypothetical protein
VIGTSIAVLAVEHLGVENTMRVRQNEARQPMRSIGGCRRTGSRQSNDIGMAMLKIARLRYQIFRDRFGRDPAPDEPLFFDSQQNEPVVAGASEMSSQLMHAANVTRSDYLSVMRYLGLD